LEKSNTLILKERIRVGAVSYLNTKPLVYGFEQGMMKDEIDIVFDYPAKIAARLINNEIDLGLIPVAAIPKLKEHHIISSVGIGAVNPVASVCLFSQVPVNEITHILMDYQSRTSAALLKILLRDHWKINPELIDSKEGFQDLIKGTTAGLVIGDRALVQRKHSKFIYDLAEGWKKMTGLPFLFATWVANKKLPDDFIARFDEAVALGFDHIDEIVEANPFPDYNLKEYYTFNIDYNLDSEKRKALNLFLTKL